MGQEQASDNTPSARGSWPFGGAMLWRWSKSASPLEFAVTKNASASLLECALKKLLDLKPPEIISYKNMPGVPPPFTALLIRNSHANAKPQQTSMSLMPGRQSEVRSGRLLLRHAVQRPKSQHEVLAGDADHITVRQQCGQGIECDSIVRVIERGNKHQLVCDVEVCVTGRESLAIEVQRLWHRQRLDAQRSAILISHFAQQGDVFLQRLIVHVRFVFFDDGHNRSGVHEPCQIIHMAVGIIAGDATHGRSEEHTSELQSLAYLVCRLLLEKKKKTKKIRLKTLNTIQ